MKKILLLTLVITLLPAAKAVELKPYISVRGGYEYTEQEYLLSVDGLNAGVVGGIKIGEMFRAEMAYTYKHFTGDSEIRSRDINSLDTKYITANIKQQTLLFNLFFYPLHTMSINPFIGAGAGIGLNHTEFSTFTVDAYPNKGNFAYAFYIGADYDISKHWAIEIIGSYNSIINPYTELDPPNIKNFSAQLGVRYTF